MTTDNQTNFVYIANTLQSTFPAFYKRLIKVFKSNDIKYGILPHTKDMWARDYMPIQVYKDRFIEYRYDPDYLQGKEKGRRNLKTYPDIVCNAIKRETIKTDIILDGGNVIRTPKSVILTDKTLEENKRSYNREELVKKLKEIFKVENIILIPWDKKHDEVFGHADGMLRFIKGNKILIQGTFDYYKNPFKYKLYKALEQNGFKLEKLKFDVQKQTYNLNWAYINFLQTRDFILVPKLGIAEDKHAFSKIKECFPEYSEKGRIKQILMREVVEKGKGALNCLTWTIKV